ncbi:hypothetical protein Leryth_025752 [Lithospermum erythrorhizon]|nr:hypothetical protein Leryth_025752 [Lithospermum erythrorhizon]
MSMTISTTLSCFRAPNILSSAAPHHRKHHQSLPKATPSPPSTSWWTPLFGWPSNPNYINIFKMESKNQEMDRPVSKFSLGCFTEEKAREMRKKMKETSRI